jgi:hypothetical protein
MVHKKNEKWCICTDFTDLNKCCPKDDFPLAKIDQIIDFAAGCDIMALLDYFQAIIRYDSAGKMKKRLVS